MEQQLPRTIDSGVTSRSTGIETEIEIGSVESSRRKKGGK
jgi:hypothetical protein